MNSEDKSNNTQIWKQAVDLYAKIAELSVNDALNHLDKINNLSYELKQAVITLVNSGNQASQYIQENLTPDLRDLSATIPGYEKGTTLGEYELLEKLGQGGMSQVYKAQRIGGEAQKKVAIKIFSPKSFAPALLDHFINEQNILADLDYPHIVDMLHGGRTDNDIVYLVMELINNALPITDYCKKHQIPVKQKIRFITQCAEALAYSHANLIIHRDLKPDNILIDNQNNLKIVDFGIAKLINNDLNSNKTTIMALTPSYAAPEQINSEKISIKTDIFSLAVVALELLANKQVLPKDRLLKSCANDETAIEKVIKKLNVDKDLKNILQQALQQDPQNRYASMQSFAEDLENYLNDNPVNATSQSFYYRLCKFARRRTALFAAMVSLLASLLVGFAITLWQYQQIKIEAGKAQQVKQFMLDSFEVTDPDIAKGTNISAKDLLELSKSKLIRNTSLDNNIKFDLLQTLALASGKLGLINDAINLLKQSLIINPKDSKSQSYLIQYLYSSSKLNELNTVLKSINIKDILSVTDKARIYRVQVKILIKNSEFVKAQKLLQTVLILNEKDNYGYDQTLTQRLQVELYSAQSQNQEAIDALNDILKTSNLDSNNTLIISMESDLAALYDEIGNAELSIKQWQKVIKKQRTILGDNHPNLAKSLAGLSASYRHNGELEKSLESIKQARQLSIKLTGENSLETANILNTLAMVLFDKGEIDESIKLIYQVVKIYENKYSRDFIDTYVVKTNLATILSQTGRTQESYEIIKDVYQHHLQKLGKNNYDTISAQQLLARNLADLGNKKEAIKLAKSAIENSQVYLNEGSNNDILFGTYYTLAKIYESDRKYQLAIDNILQIIDKKLINKKGLKYAILIHTIAKIYDVAGKYDKAQKHYIISIGRYKELFGTNHPRTLMAQIKYGNLLKTNHKDKQLNILIDEINNTIDAYKINNSEITNALKSL